MRHAHRRNTLLNHQQFEGRRPSCGASASASATLRAGARHALSTALVGASAWALAAGCASELEDPAGEGQPSVYASVPVATTLRLPNSLGIAADGSNLNMGGASNAGGQANVGGATGGQTTGGTTGAGGATQTPATCPAPTPAVCGTVTPAQIFGDPNACGGASCHGSPDQAPIAYLDLGYTTDNLAQRLSTTFGTGLCEPYTIIDPRSADDSILLDKIWNDPPTCGGKMPPGTPLSDQQRDCITEWVRAEVACLQ